MEDRGRGEKKGIHKRKESVFTVTHTQPLSLTHINTHRQLFHMHVYARAMAYSYTKTPLSSRRKLVRHLCRQSKHCSPFSMSQRETLWNWYYCDDFVTSSHHFSSIQPNLVLKTKPGPGFEVLHSSISARDDPESWYSNILSTLQHTVGKRNLRHCNTQCGLYLRKLQSTRSSTQPQATPQLKARIKTRPHVHEINTRLAHTTRREFARHSKKHVDIYKVMAARSERCVCAVDNDTR